MAGKPPILERTRTNMKRWPSSWEIDDDRDAGEVLVAALATCKMHADRWRSCPPYVQQGKMNQLAFRLD